MTGNGWVEAGTFTDNDISASKGKRRPDYDRMMAAAARGEFDVVVAYQQSRIWRNPVERAQAIEVLRKAEVSVVFAKGAPLDLSTASGRMMARMLGEFDTMEAEVKGERTQRAQRDAAKAGLHLGGPRPFGWRLVPDPARAGRPDALRLVKPELHETEAAEVQRLARELLAGRSLGALVRDLNDRGVRTTWGRPWAAASLRAALTRPRNYGVAEFNGAEFPGAWPAILDEATHRKLVTLLADPGRRLSPDNKVKYLLSGIARCGMPGCGDPEEASELGSLGGLPVKSASTANRDGSRRRLYKCPSEHLFRSQEACDYVVTSEVLGWLSAMSPADRMALLAGEDHDSPAAADVAKLRAKLAELLEMWEADEITRAEYKVKAASLRAQLQAAERRMAQVSRVPVLAELLSAGDVQAAWEALPLDRQRAVLRELIVPVIRPHGTGRKWPGREGWTAQDVGISIRVIIGKYKHRLREPDPEDIRLAVEAGEW